MAKLSGRLELTWTNKHERLLAREDGSYSWVPRADYRVAEVRLLREAGTSGETHADPKRTKDNLLIRGDALHALTSLNSLPEFASEYQGKVRLVYLDPPFNTQQAFAQYDDALEHSVWLTMMRDRLLQVKKLLAPGGSVWVHLDQYEVAYCQVLMDEVFGRDAHVANVVWQARKHPDNKVAIYEAHNTLLVYGSDQAFSLRPRTDDGSYSNPDNDPRGPWDSHPLDAAGKGGRLTPSLVYPIVNPNTGTEHWPKEGRMWSVSQADMERLMDDKRIYFGKKGTAGPRKKAFLSEVREGFSWSSLWVAGDLATNDEADRHQQQMFGRARFETTKPEELMERIIAIASDRGDVVLDCFAGSGTTAAVAHKLGRRWVTVEWSRDTIERFTGPRLNMVIGGEDVGGITTSAGWEGGGGFRVLDVAPSMFDEDEGQVVLADWAFGTALAEATAAQLGFAFDPDTLPFCGRKGRTRLAVVDGLVNDGVVRLLAAELADDERLTVCGIMVDPAARDVLSELRPGSSLRKVPESILADYRLGQRWWDGGLQKSLSVDGAASAEAALPVD